MTAKPTRAPTAWLSTLLAELVASETAKAALLERIERSLVVGAR